MGREWLWSGVRGPSATERHGAGAQPYPKPTLIMNSHKLHNQSPSLHPFLSTNKPLTPFQIPQFFKELKVLSNLSILSPPPNAEREWIYWLVLTLLKHSAQFLCFFQNRISNSLLQVVHCPNDLNPHFYHT
jgi:hypothetical protein